MLIDFLSGKGGTGKTTLALHVAGALAADGARVVVVDLDPQQSARAWYEFARGEGFTAFAVVSEMTPAAAKKADFVLFDHPPVMTERAIGSTIVLTIQPSFFDVAAARKIAPFLGSSARVIDVLNRFSASRQEDAAILEELDPACVMRDRSIYRRALSGGVTLHDPRAYALFGAPAARAEVDRLTDLIIQREEKAA